MDDAVPTANATADISLPAESLSPDADMADVAPAPDTAPAINIIAEKLRDLPVLGAHPGFNVSMNDAMLPNEDDALADAHGFLVSGDYAAAINLYGHVLAAHTTSRAALSGKAFAQ